MKTIFLIGIKVYQLTLRPFLGHNCRFYPTCSDFGYLAIQKYGAAKGGFLTLKRLLKCHPWHPGGCDPVP